jgi:uncharacterized protein YebE (UPF0316 family)
MSRTYSKMTCFICKKTISAGGGGIHHLKAHAKDGNAQAIKILQERKRYKLLLMKTRAKK